MRDKAYARKRLVRDLAALGLRHRRAHDLRRTGISIAQDDGADRAILRWATHAPPREVFDLYTSHAWATLCREVAKLRARIVRAPPGFSGSPGGADPG
jgi:integrase